MSLLLQGCSHLALPAKVISKPVIRDRPAFVHSPVDKVKTRDINWTIITKNNVDDQIKPIFLNNGQAVLFVLNHESYNALVLNLADMFKLIKQQKSVINAYENYYHKK